MIANRCHTPQSAEEALYQIVVGYAFGFPSGNYGVRGKSGETRSMRQIGPPS